MFRFVATCMVTVAKKIKQCGAGGLLGSKHQGHNVSIKNLVNDLIAISRVPEAQRKHYLTLKIISQLQWFYFSIVF